MAVFASAAYAAEPDAGMPAGPVAAAPKGYVAMCRDQPQLCPEATRTGGPEQSEATEIASADQFELLRKVNQKVNSRVRQMRDVEAFGVQGLWTRAGEAEFGAVGDCKAIAVEKRIELEAAGIAPSALYYAIAYRSDIGLHAVLVAHTSRGDLVLDSRTPHLTPWSKAPYTWVRRQSQGQPFAWAMVVALSKPVVLARADAAPSGSRALERD